MDDEHDDDPLPLADFDEDTGPQHNKNSKYDDDSVSGDDDNLLMAFPDLAKKFVAKVNHKIPGNPK